MTDRNKTPNSNRYRSYDELPVTLTVADIQNVFGLSRSAAYRLLHEPCFPTIRVGNILRVPKDLFLLWMQERTMIAPSGVEGNSEDGNAGDDTLATPFVQKAQEENPKIVVGGDSYSRENPVSL